MVRHAKHSESSTWRSQAGAWVLAWLLCWAGFNSAHAQSKAELQRQRDAITAQLATTERLLTTAKKNRNNAVAELQLVDQRIVLREQLIRHHKQEIASLEREMAGTDSEIRTLEGHIAQLKDEYARMIVQAYRMHLAQNPLLYLFSAEDFSQAALRFQLLQSYATLRKEQVDAITRNQQQLTVERTALTTARERAGVVLAEMNTERDRLAADRSGRAALVDKLKREESRLREEQKKAEKERNRLNNEISRMIEKELAAERATTSGEFALTPAGKVVSEQFEKNKALLAWPVKRGVVTGKFGRQNHPTLAGIVLDNNGIDLTTDAGAEVTAVFKGTVSSVFQLPGAGSTVILSHGAYRTVYSNLESVSVSKGATVNAGAAIGRARTVEGSGTVHFEVWHIDGSNKTPQNPQQWLTKK